MLVLLVVGVGLLSMALYDGLDQYMANDTGWLNLTMTDFEQYKANKTACMVLPSSLHPPQGVQDLSRCVR